MIAVDPQVGTIDADFLLAPASPIHRDSPRGRMIAAMLDDTLEPAVFAMSGAERMTTTIDLHVHYVRPVRPGRVTMTAKVINLGSRIAFVEGWLFDLERRLAGTATASGMLTDYRPG